VLVTSSSGLTGARFDRYSLDLTSGALLRSGVRVPLQGQPFQVLRLLLEAEGKVVTRDELRTALWPEDTFVDFELGVNTAVKKLRQALEDSAEHPRFIETLPKFGYRFMLAVEWVNGTGTVAPIAPPEPQPPVLRPPPIQRQWKLMAIVAVAALALVALLISLSDENSYLSRTRLGMLTRRVAFGRSTPTQPNITERRLTANPEDTPITSSVISPDGKYLAYTDKTGFYLRQVVNGETHPVPLPKGFEPVAESWFPDGIHVAVSWVEQPNHQPSIWEISVLGGSPRKLVDDAYSARVSLDGSKIAFSRREFGSEAIWLMEVENGHAQRIAGATEAEIEDRFSPAAWCPDGGRLVFVRSTPRYHDRDENKIEVADVITGAIRAVLSNPGLGPGVSWTQDNRLVYSLQEAEPNQGDFNLWWVRLDTQTNSPLGSPSRITNGRGLAAELSVTIDGKLLALRPVAPNPDVYIAVLTNDGKRLSTPQRLTLDERQDNPFSWTPDAKSVIFMSDRDGPVHIFKQAVDQTQPELLVGGEKDVDTPRLTPDGATLLYLAPPRGDPSHIVRLMRVPLAGGPSELVLESPWLFNHQCARPPSTLCIYSTSGPTWVKFSTFDPVTGSSAEILEVESPGPGNVNWSLSPDGHYLATGETKLAIHPTIRIFSIADKTWRIVPVPGWAQIGGIDWAADGKSIWVGATRRTSSFGRLDIWALLKVDFDGTVSTVLENSTVRFLYAIPSPDGRRLALYGATDPSNVWLLQNF
jgi:DNA-binding winged helix-turn-helix (wHTH) protein/Tol biopolymer transport system component